MHSQIPTISASCGTRRNGCLRWSDDELWIREEDLQFTHKLGCFFAFPPSPHVRNDTPCQALESALFHPAPESDYDAAAPTFLSFLLFLCFLPYRFQSHSASGSLIHESIIDRGFVVSSLFWCSGFHDQFYSALQYVRHLFQRYDTDGALDEYPHLARHEQKLLSMTAFLSSSFEPPFSPF